MLSCVPSSHPDIVAGRTLSLYVGFTQRLQSIATAVVYLRADAQAHEVLLKKHRYCQTPQTEEITFEGSTF
ncbi:MAG TPA: hypothetical protein VF294_14215, partial [Polyangiaceae bacterium]